jgi:predicted PurR-regulated permease PerM
LADSLERFALARRVLVIALVVLAVFGLAALIIRAASVLLLAFGGILFAVLLDGTAGWIARRTGVHRYVALALVGLAIAGVIAGTVMLAGPALAAQVSGFQSALQSGLATVRVWLDDIPFAGALADELGRAGTSGPEVARRLAGVFSTAAGGLGALAVIVFVGFYLAADPEVYQRGLLHLVDHQHRDRAVEVLAGLGRALRGWLLGQFVSMTLIGSLVAIGLTIIGVPLAPLLGFITFLFQFVPYVGPIASGIPAVLVALTGGPQLALMTAGLYTGIQFVESYLITPLVQRKMVHLQPAVLLLSELLVGALAGLLGLILAAPLAVCAVVLVQMLYVQDLIGDDVQVLGEAEPERGRRLRPRRRRRGMAGMGPVDGGIGPVASGEEARGMGPVASGEGGMGPVARGEEMGNRE